MTASDRAHELVRLAAAAADHRSGFDLVALDVSETTPLTDAFLIASGRNERMVLSIGEEIEERLAKDAGQKALRREGRETGRWVLLDFGDLVVHVFHEEDRAFYELERLWRDAPIMPLGFDDAAAEGGHGEAAGEGHGADEERAADQPDADRTDDADGPGTTEPTDAADQPGASTDELSE